MKILHISTECYPAAKAGGLGDVVGALPKYLTKIGAESAVVLPKYQTKWLNARTYETVYLGTIEIVGQTIPFSIERESEDSLGFPFYVAHIPGKFDRPGLYADETGTVYPDELERYISFQSAVLDWVLNMKDRPAVLHCHDYHTGLIPFLVTNADKYKDLHFMPTVFTIHNAEYHGSFGWGQMHLLPKFDLNQRGLLDWNNSINPLATGIKSSWRLTTVSPSYMEELRRSAHGLEVLLQHERSKSVGILNGIDNLLWDPTTDAYLHKNLKGSINTYKKENKNYLLEHFKVKPDLPLFTFIGRLVGEKGADILPDLIRLFLSNHEDAVFIVLGTGDPGLHEQFTQMKAEYEGYFDVALEYNEGLAHNLYAGSDFLLMPSRVEPCGLNQMYALRYGTVPVVRSVGGLKDSIIDIKEKDGRGIRFDHLNVNQAYIAIRRAIELYTNTEAFKDIRKRIMKLDFSWERSAEEYLKIYRELSEDV